MGFNLAGALKAIVSGVGVTIGSIIAGIPDPLNALRIFRAMVLVVATALALISMMFLLMVRVSDPLIPRAIFGVLNTVLFFPSGAVYPIQAFPSWMKVITTIDPFTYAVHGFKQILLKKHQPGRHLHRPVFSGVIYRDLDDRRHLALPADVVRRPDQDRPSDGTRRAALKIALMFRQSSGLNFSVEAPL